MIVATFGGAGAQRTLDISGHARSGSEGSPEVCAAASALAFALAEFLHDKDADMSCKDSDGHMMLSSSGDAHRDAWGVTETGFEQLAANYPQFVKIIYNFSLGS